MEEPTRDEWEGLYGVAMQFKEMAPWRWMANDDLFAVENPGDGEVGYCSIMENGGMEYGLAVFLGAEGIASYRRLAMEEVDTESREALASLRSLSVTFVDREYVDKRDREVARTLGLRFRGVNGWLLFRSLRPGYAPWYLEQEEALFLDIALRLAVRVAGEVREDKIHLSHGAQAGLLLTFSSRNGEWVQEWRKPPMTRKEPEAMAPADQARLGRLRQGKEAPQGRWELDLSLMPIPVGSKRERPYYPTLLMAVDQAGIIVATQTLEPWASAAQRQEALLQALENAPGLPAEIRVSSQEVRRLVEPMAKALGISTRVSRLPRLTVIREDLFRSLMGRL